MHRLSTHPPESFFQQQRMSSKFILKTYEFKAYIVNIAKVLKVCQQFNRTRTNNNTFLKRRVLFSLNFERMSHFCLPDPNLHPARPWQRQGAKLIQLDPTLVHY